MNYLIPTDFDAENAAGVRFDAVSAVDVQEMLQRARVAMLVFDACRNNPYRGFRDAGGGLAPLEARGTLIAYAAGAGELAADAAPGADNGLFTSKFVEALAEPNLTASDLFRRVRREVHAASNEEQWPAVYDDLLADFVFRSSPAGGGNAAVTTGGGADPTADGAGAVPGELGQETVFWESIRNSRDPADFRAYKRRFPGGVYEDLVDNRLAALAGGADPPPSPSATERHRAGDVFRDCNDCPQMVVVPSATFTMGSPAAEDGREDYEGPQHRVTIPVPFAVGVYEVTRDEFARFVSATGHVTGDKCVSSDSWDPVTSPWDGVAGLGWRHPGFEQTDEHPVVCVSWEDAQAYVRWLSNRTGEGYRLLSESEWEYVARAGTTTAYWWGDSVGRNRANCDGCGSRWDAERTAPVGSFLANGFGLHDVSGNAWEWVEDCLHVNYHGGPTDGSAWTSGCGDFDDSRTVRGGSWALIARYLRSAYRGAGETGMRSNDVGFRVSRMLD